MNIHIAVSSKLYLVRYDDYGLTFGFWINFTIYRTYIKQMNRYWPKLHCMYRQVFVLSSSIYGTGAFHHIILVTKKYQQQKLAWPYLHDTILFVFQILTFSKDGIDGRKSAMYSSMQGGTPCLSLQLTTYSRNKVITNTTLIKLKF